jgi:hypothetical protein
MPDIVDDLINNVVNNVTDPNDAIDAVLDMVNPIHVGARVIVTDTGSEYYGVIGDVIELTKDYDEMSENEVNIAKVKVIRPMVVRSTPVVTGYPINSTDPDTMADMGSEIEVPADQLALLTTPNGSSIRNTRQGAIDKPPVD